MTNSSLLMGGLSTRQDQVRLWAALSDVFVDNAVDYASVARNLKSYERSTIEMAFFVDVAPACAKPRHANSRDEHEQSIGYPLDAEGAVRPVRAGDSPSGVPATLLEFKPQ